MTITSQAEMTAMLKAGQAVQTAFKAMKAATKPGISTAALDQIGAQVLNEWGARSAPQLYYDFPGATCISVNEQAAHGIPSPDRVLAAGDMINIDVSANLEGYVADMGQSFVVLDEGESADGGAAELHREQARICAAVEEAVLAAIARVHSGCNLNVIGEAVQEVADREGYQIVRNLGSHGVGASIHEEPSYVPYDNPQETRRLAKGTALTIEPFFCTGTDWVDEEDDGWTLSVPSGCLVAQFEHTVVVTDSGAVVITG